MKKIIMKVPFQNEIRSYTVAADEATTVLDALEIIRRDQEPDLIYRHSCHHASCGTCACLVNGAEKLACTTKLLSLGTETVELAPLKGMRVVSGLAFDAETVIASIPSDWVYKRKSELGGEAETERFEDCIECGACLSSCPPFAGGSSFVGPAALAALNRERLNNPDTADGLLKKSDSEAWAWGCKRAINCSRVCPAGVAPAKKIQELRNEIEK